MEIKQWKAINAKVAVDSYQYKAINAKLSMDYCFKVLLDRNFPFGEVNQNRSLLMIPLVFAYLGDIVCLCVSAGAQDAH